MNINFVKIILFALFAHTLMVNESFDSVICNKMSDITNSRTGPSAKKFPVSDILKNNQKIDVIDSIENEDGYLYYKIKYFNENDRSEKIGYVFNKAVSQDCELADGIISDETNNNKYIVNNKTVISKNEILGSKNLKGAKLIKNLIWQDEPINEKRHIYRYEEAQEYCRNLTLLGVKGWSLPTVSNYKELGENMKDLQFIADSDFSFMYYFTKDENCSGNSGVIYIRPGECVFVANIKNNKNIPDIEITRQRNVGSVRCVLQVDKYNEERKIESEKYSIIGDFDGYLKAFISSGDKRYIEKANSLALTRRQKELLEHSLIKYIGYSKIFSISSKIYGGKDNDNSISNIDNQLLLTSITSSKGETIIKYEIKPNLNSTLPLEYGKYSIKLHAHLDMKYHLVTGGIGTSDSGKIDRYVSVEVGPMNNWSASGEINFNKIDNGTKANVLMIDYSRKLTDIKYYVSIDDIELL